MKTYRKIQTSTGPLYRDGGFYVNGPGGVAILYQLVQVTTFDRFCFFNLLCRFIRTSVVTVMLLVIY